MMNGESSEMKGEIFYCLDGLKKYLIILRSILFFLKTKKDSYKGPKKDFIALRRFKNANRNWNINCHWTRLITRKILKLSMINVRVNFTSVAKKPSELILPLCHTSPLFLTLFSFATSITWTSQSLAKSEREEKYARWLFWNSRTKLFLESLIQLLPPTERDKSCNRSFRFIFALHWKTLIFDILLWRYKSLKSFSCR